MQNHQLSNFANLMKTIVLFNSMCHEVRYCSSTVTDILLILIIIFNHETTLLKIILILNFILKLILKYNFACSFAY